MIGTRFEEYSSAVNGLPFVLHRDLERTLYSYSKEQNWHEDLEIQLCISGKGTVFLNGEKYKFEKDDIIVANSNEIHYTGTDTKLTYSCLIISPSFCKQMGIDLNSQLFLPYIKSTKLKELFFQLCEMYSSDVLYKTAKLNEILLKILIELCENYSFVKESSVSTRTVDKVKSAINYIRNNYNQHISLVDIAVGINTDKYALCRDFKRITGQTVVEYLNKYRCLRAAEYISSGYSVSQSAYSCGFENLSFFTRVFKHHMGILPSKYQLS